MLQKIVAIAAAILWPIHALAAEAVIPALPRIPDRTFNLADFGGVGDGKTLNTGAFNKAIAAVAAGGGGKLIVPEGIYLTLPFALTGHMDLHLNEGSVIQFPTDLTIYGLPGDPGTATHRQMSEFHEKTPALISGENLSDVAITGSGAIDGGGASWWSLSVKGPDGAAHTAYGNYRPKLVVISHSSRLHFQGVTFRNSPRYNLAPTLCHDVFVESVHITAPQHAPNTDAIDPMACDNVLIRDCDLDVGDDNVAVKAIEGPCSNIMVENCRCLHGHGISIGSETYKGIHDVTVRNCTFDGTTNGIRIKSARDRGNDIYGFTFSNITMKNVGTALSINMYYMDKTGSHDRESIDVTASTPHLHDVHISDVTVESAGVAGDITGLPEAPVEDVTLSNVKISANKGMTVKDAKGIVFNNVEITAKTGQSFTSEFAEVQWNK